MTLYFTFLRKCRFHRDQTLSDTEEYNGCTISFLLEDDCIAIKHDHLAVYCTQIIKGRYTTIISLKYQGIKYYVTIKDNIFLAGVEEAHHDYYVKSKQGRYTKNNKTLKEYKSNPIEIAALPVVRQAIQEQGIQIYTCSNILGNIKYLPCPYPKWNR